MKKSELNKIIKEVKTYPLLFDMDRLEFIRQLMSLHIKILDLVCQLQELFFHYHYYMYSQNIL